MSNLRELEINHLGIMVGGWKPYRVMDAETQQVFDQAVNLLGVDYSPIAVASQLVAGVNYSFFCNAKVVGPNTPNEAVMILVYVNPEGLGKLQSIQSVPR